MPTLMDEWRAAERRHPGLFVSPRICRGVYEVCHVDEATGLWTPRFSKENLVLYTWGFLACKCVGVGDPAYKVGAAYLEYKNVVNPADAVSVPGYDRSGGLAYFNALPPDQDFLRVPLAGPPAIDILPGYENYFTSGVSGNRCTFVAQSSGAAGVLGRPYSDAAQSKVFGITLVATPVFADRSQDVPLCRGYFNVPDQQLKQTGSQVGVRWQVAFT